MNINRVRLYLTLFLAFLVGNYQGYIALWTADREKPDYVFPYSVASLPAEDQAALIDGIQISTEQELRQLLEDYLS